MLFRRNFGEGGWGTGLGLWGNWRKGQSGGKKNGFARTLDPSYFTLLITLSELRKTQLF
jgi:hypothetical protein